MLHAAVRSQEVNPAKLPLLFRKQFELCKIKPGETIAIVSDLGTRRDYIEAAFAAADDLGADIYEMCVNAIPGWTKVGVPTIGKCKGTLEALMACDMVLIFHVPLFSAWLRQVMNNKVAGADDHRRARRSRAAAIAPRPQGSGASRPGALPEDQIGPRHQRRRDRPHLCLRRISRDEPVRHGR